MVEDISPFHHHNTPIYNIKRTTVNVYKIDSGTVDRLGSGIQVSATLQKIHHPVGRLGLGLGSEPHVVGRSGEKI